MNNEITINNVIYEKKTSSIKKACDYYIVRSELAGVFAGYIESRVGNEITMRNARRIWLWGGSASLSELAMRGTSQPLDCKFPVAVDRVVIFGAIEILDVTDVAKQSIASVPVWSAFNENE